MIFQIIVFLSSLILSLLIVPFFIRLCNKAKILSRPRQKNELPKPCLGGIGIYIAFLIPILILSQFLKFWNANLFGIILGSSFILFLGLVDDLNELNPSAKLFGELIGIIIFILFGITTKIVLIPLYLNLIITVFWLLLITNAFNLLDILDGLSSGLIIISAITFSIISLLTNDFLSSILLACLAGAHLGFLIYNYPPAKIYMGDAGSLFSGALLGAVAINISYAPLERKMALLTPILAMSLPIYDTLFLIIMRLKKQRPVFQKSNDHFALRLITIGYSKKKTIWFMYLFSIFLSISAITISRVSNLVAFFVTGFVLLVFLFFGKKIGMVKVDG